MLQLFKRLSFIVSIVKLLLHTITKLQKVSHPQMPFKILKCFYILLFVYVSVLSIVFL